MLNIIGLGFTGLSCKMLRLFIFPEVRFIAFSGWPISRITSVEAKTK